MRFRFLLTVFSTFILLYSCEEEKKKKTLPFKSKADYEETMIASHQAFLKEEREKILAFIDSSQFPFDSTGTGLRYYIYQANNGDSLKSGDIAVIHYQLSDLEGNLLYETKAELAHEFAVDYDDVESGLHEGIKKMRIGERAILILPAHIAHGVTGDQAAIPSQTTLVYDVFLIGKK